MRYIILLLLCSSAFADFKPAILITDSIALNCQGCDAKDLYPHLIAEKINVSLQVLGTGGMRISRFTESEMTGASYIPSGLVDHIGDVQRISLLGARQVIVALGLNDNKPVKDVMCDLRYFIHAMKDLGVEVVVLTPVHAQGIDNPSMRLGMMHVCTQEKVTCIDGWSFTDNDNSNYSDGVHRNKQGHQQIANGLINAMHQAGEW